jgi:hypothetical protein
MTFEPKISGTRVEGFSITPIFAKQIVLLSDAQKVIKRQETMNCLLDNFRFTKCNENYPNEWYAILDFDTIFKLSVLENYPEYEKEFIDYFGKSWFKQYIRFNH